MHHCPFVPKRPVSSMVRLAYAIQNFSCGSTYDNMLTQHLAHIKVLISVWFVVDTKNSKLIFLQITLFNPLQVGWRLLVDSFANCADCIDRLLMWIHKLLEEGVKIWNWEKKSIDIKILACQAVVDVQIRIFDTSQLYWEPHLTALLLRLVFNITD